MATGKQLAANRANAKHSTGPKTKEGKKRSRMNSCKHGLSAKAILVDEEDPADFDELHKNLIVEFSPRPGAEAQLVFRLAALFWRLRRIPAFEANSLRTREATDYRDDPRVAQILSDQRAMLQRNAEVCARFILESGIKIPENDKKVRDAEDKVVAPTPTQLPPPVTTESEHQETLAKISRHENALQNSLNRTFNVLFGLQNMGGERA
jgi:hypothetical protein